jgi:redox-sensing transcriptional repressor
MPATPIPDIVIGRLPLYLRGLAQMGGRLGISSAQIRKDLSQFGEFGKQGTGYDIAFLIEQLRRILKVDRVWDVALVGVGDLGRAVAHYAGFLDRGFRIAVLYDNDPAKIGGQVATMVVQGTTGMVDDIRARGLRVAMLAVPAAAAQQVTDQLVEAGIQAILC